MTDKLNLVSKLTPENRAQLEFRLDTISPEDGKYADASEDLYPYLTPRAEWLACVNVQRILLETRTKFGQAKEENVQELEKAIKKIDPLNISLLEKEVTRHDQLAVIEEIGRHVSPETKALLHPGTTSYDILDTARSYLFKNAWTKVIRPELKSVTDQFCDIAEESIDILQVGRTHLKYTSPVLFGGTMAGYAARLANRIQSLDKLFKNLKGKISGIVGTGAGIEMVIGEGRAIAFEKAVLSKLDLDPDHTATQIVQKEALADVGNGIVTLAHVLADFAGDIRLLYSSDIEEVTSRDSAQRLGGSSTDASKDNPINYENMEGKVPEIESGMRVLYAMVKTDLQRDLRSSVQARYQPQAMMAQTYEMSCRMSKALDQLSINKDKVAENLQKVREFPSEAMVSILRGERWVHSQYGEGHTFVKEMSKMAKKGGSPLLSFAYEDEEFKKIYDNLPENKRRILQGELELYTGAAKEKAQINIEYARSI